MKNGVDLRSLGFGLLAFLICAVAAMVVVLASWQFAVALSVTPLLLIALIQSSQARLITVVGGALLVFQAPGDTAKVADEEKACEAEELCDQESFEAQPSKAGDGMIRRAGNGVCLNPHLVGHGPADRTARHQHHRGA